MREKQKIVQGGEPFNINLGVFFFVTLMFAGLPNQSPLLTIIQFTLLFIENVLRRLVKGCKAGMKLGVRKYPFTLCFRVLSNQYVERSAYANVFKFNRENKRVERAKVNSRCFH